MSSLYEVFAQMLIFEDLFLLAQEVPLNCLEKLLDFELLYSHVTII